ncbi:Fe-S protein assembly chaperone HscA [Thiomonas sp.]|jgi:molecular chaperone HscA|uniref:Fe-S protein assembly chaperone HscA n=1 Tax=Thiomonas sp. TaxID=2047785 RepID=UPI002616D348|nr:Fe-S protein assembly chaperone HscA [Thiomonas sp.]
MALLQISEPGQSPDPHQRRVAIGIDLGTTHSLVAVVRSGVAECLPDAQGRVLLPSVVRYAARSQPSIGWDALAAKVADPHNTVVSVKRFMGRGLDDLDAHQRASYDFEPRPGMVALRTAAGVKTPVEVSADILRELGERARAALGVEPVGAVITVPAYFDDAQRQATKDAARLAGLPVLRLINEPTAAALAYGLDRAASGVWAVYDLGGGTFDVSVLRLSRGVFEVMATGGDTALGGDDYDQRVAAELARRAGLGELDAAAQAALRRAARQAKESLSAQQRAPVRLDLGAAGSVDTELSREEFEACTRDLTLRTVELLGGVLEDADVAAQDMSGIILVGGATRMPVVREAVREFFGRAPMTDLDPDEVVAIGAARQAHALAGNTDDDTLLLDVIALSLGLETMGGLVERVIPRNSTIPTARAQEFTTYKDGQTAMSIHVVQGERELVSDCRSLARFELRGIPPMPAGAARVLVTFQVDADGLLEVSAREASSGVQAHVEVRPSYGLDDAQIADMLRSAFSHADTDAASRALREEQVEAERLLDATRTAMQADSDLLEADERDAIHAAMAGLAQAARGGDHLAIRDAIGQLARATEPFAAQRMNRSIQRALSGRSIDSLAGNGTADGE